MLSERDYMTHRTRQGFFDGTSVIMPLIVLNILIFLACKLFGETGRTLSNLLTLHPWYIRHGQLWRLITYLFAHGDFWHIAFNMWGVYMFGRLLERGLGAGRFLTLYLTSGVIGGLAWLLFNWSQPIVAVLSAEGANYPVGPVSMAQLESLVEEHSLHVSAIAGGVIGASGALFGVMVATAMAFPDLLVSLLFPPVTLKMRTMVIIYMLIEVLACFNTSSHIAHLAHLGGGLGGFLYMNRLRRQAGYGGLFATIGGWFRNFRQKRSHSAPRDEEIMRILSKIAQVGYENLTQEEKETLERASDQMRKR